ncbi:unnamed protein product [Bathycoccus prasinos]
MSLFSIFSAFCPCATSLRNAFVASFPLYCSNALFPPGCEKCSTFNTSPSTIIRKKDDLETSSRIWEPDLGTRFGLLGEEIGIILDLYTRERERNNNRGGQRRKE